MQQNSIKKIMIAGLIAIPAFVLADHFYETSHILDKDLEKLVSLEKHAKDRLNIFNNESHPFLESKAEAKRSSVQATDEIALDLK